MNNDELTTKARNKVRQYYGEDLPASLSTAINAATTPEAVRAAVVKYQNSNSSIIGTVNEGKLGGELSSIISSVPIASPRPTGGGFGIVGTVANGIGSAVSGIAGGIGDVMGGSIAYDPEDPSSKDNNLVDTMGDYISYAAHGIGDIMPSSIAYDPEDPSSKDNNLVDTMGDYISYATHGVGEAMGGSIAYDPEEYENNGNPSSPQPVSVPNPVSVPSPSPQIGYVEPNGGYNDLGGSSATPTYSGSADTMEHNASGYVEPNGGYNDLGGSSATPTYSGSADTMEHNASGYVEPNGGYNDLGGSSATPTYSGSADTMEHNASGYVEPNGGYNDLGGSSAPSIDPALQAKYNMIDNTAYSASVKQQAKDAVAAGNSAPVMDILAFCNGGAIGVQSVSAISMPSIDPALQAKYNMIDNTAYSASVKQQAKDQVAAGNNSNVNDIMAFINGGYITVQTPSAISIPTGIPAANSSSTPSIIPSGAGSISSGFKS